MREAAEIQNVSPEAIEALARVRWRSPASSMPIPLLFRTYRSVAALYRFRRRHDHLPVVSPDAHWAALSDETRQAIDALGGVIHVTEQLESLDRLGVAAAATFVTISPTRWHELLTLDGLECAQRLADAARPAIVINPHIGSGLVLFAFLSALGRRTFSFGGQPHPARRRMFDTARRISGFNYAAFVEGAVPTPTAWMRASAFLKQRNAVFLWQPDVFLVGGSRPPEGAPRIVDVAVTRTPPVVTIAKRRDADVFFGYATVDLARPPRVHLTLRRFDELNLSAILAETNRVILSNLDQWRSWKDYPTL